LPGRFVVEANYNGSKGRHLLAQDGPTSEDYNRFDGDLLDGVRNRLNPSFASVDFNQSRIASNYQGMTLQVQRRHAKGFSFQAAYTYGILKDTPAPAMDVTRPDLDYSYAGFDIRHKLALNFVVEVPYAPANQALKAVLGGWQVNGVAILQSGAPFTVTCTQAYPRCDFNADGANTDRVNLPSFGTNLGNPDQQKWLAGVFTASDFTFPPIGAFGTEPRNAFRGPGFKNLDLSLFKNFEVSGHSGRRSKVQVRLEAFNIGNWVNLNNPSGSVTAATFGRVTSARGGTGPRVIQLALKYIF
jgi:hypothetical protein